MITIDEKVAQIQEVYDNLDDHCIVRMLAIAYECAGERPGFMLPHLVSLRRPIHCLAVRVLEKGRIHAESRAGWQASRLEALPGYYWLRDYLVATQDLNSAVISAANEGRLSARNAEIGTKFERLYAPTPYKGDHEILNYYADFLRGACRETVALYVAESMVLDGHFYDRYAVRPEEFSAWAYQEGIARQGEVEHLLEAQRCRADEFARLGLRWRTGRLKGGKELRGAEFAKEAARLFDPDARVDRPVVADQGAEAVANDADAVPAGQEMAEPDGQKKPALPEVQGAGPGEAVLSVEDEPGTYERPVDEGRILDGTAAKNWKNRAEELAQEIIDRDTARDLYPPSRLVAEEVEKRLREEGVVGKHGKPLALETIRREVLSGMPHFRTGRRGEA